MLKIDSGIISFLTKGKITPKCITVEEESVANIFIIQNNE
jgi:hypothetical protein